MKKMRFILAGMLLLVVGFCLFSSQVRSQIRAFSLKARGSMNVTAPPVFGEEKEGQSSELVKNTIQFRMVVPKGTHRVSVEEKSFGAWLRGLFLLPSQSPVLLYNQMKKSRQDVHEAIVDLDVGQRDLQQCADAIMRLRSEYLFSMKQPIEFHPDVGKSRVLRFVSGDRSAFSRYLTQVFTEAGSASLQAELLPVKEDRLQPGDVLIQGGFPGHAVLVLDVAEDNDGKQYVLIGQSYMPAQQFHIVKNLEDSNLSPWFDASLLQKAQGLKTPEWRAFYQKDVRRFPRNY